jgi:hypothetical protein
LANFRAKRHIHRGISADSQDFAGVVNRHIFELATADSAENHVSGDKHPGTCITRRRTFHISDFDQNTVGPFIEKRPYVVPPAQHRISLSDFVTAR